MHANTRPARRWRSAALIAIGLSIGVSMMATPATSHVGGTIDHLWSHLRAKSDVRYYTKAQSNARFLPGGDLPSARTVRGNFVVEDFAAGASSHASNAISFGWRLATPPIPHVITQGATPPADCPGTLALPAARRGHLCIFEGPNTNRSILGVGDPVTNTGNAANRYGVRLNLFSSAAGLFSTSGTWAVTAP